MKKWLIVKRLAGPIIRMIVSGILARVFLEIEFF